MTAQQYLIFCCHYSGSGSVSKSLGCMSTSSGLCGIQRSFGSACANRQACLAVPEWVPGAAAAALQTMASQASDDEHGL